MIAALFVEKDGAYFGINGIDPWDEERDARNYSGPHPVIAHPPCQRWGKMWMGSPSAISRGFPRKKKGDDGGCFAHALECVRKFGGVLEHPKQSHAWKHFGLNRPPQSGGWIKADDNGGWTCCVEQGRYGHWMRKPTWLYSVGAEALPELEWGVSQPNFPEWAIERYGIDRCKRMGEIAFKGGGVDSKPRNATPEPFKRILMEIARSTEG